MEFTKADVKKINENIEKIVAWLSSNADSTESVWVKYNFRKENAYSSPKPHDVIIVRPNGTVETGNLWGYNMTFKELTKLPTYNKMPILEQWADIKSSFLSERANLVESRKATQDLIYNFEI